MVEWVPFPYYLSRISFSRLSLTVALRHLVIALEKGECLKSCEKMHFAYAPSPIFWGIFKR